MVFPWKATSQVESSPDPPFYFAFMIGLSLLGVLHLTQGRGDTRSAWRFGLYAFCVVTVVVLLAPPRGPALIIYGPVGAGSYGRVISWAIEPWTRRLWPHVMITWARLLAGRWRDPVVGRDLLVVVACVTLNYAVQRIVVFAAVQFGAAPHAVNHPGHFGILLDSLASIRVMTANLVLPFFFGLTVGMGLFLTLFVCNALVRRKWIATIVALVLWFAGNPGVFLNWMDTLQWGLEFAFLLFLTLRFGVFAAVLFSCLSMLIDWSMFTSDFSAWYGRPSLAATLILGVLTAYAFRTSIGKRPFARDIDGLVAPGARYSAFALDVGRAFKVPLAGASGHTSSWRSFHSDSGARTEQAWPNRSSCNPIPYRAAVLWKHRAVHSDAHEGNDVRMVAAHLRAQTQSAGRILLRLQLVDPGRRSRDDVRDAVAPPRAAGRRPDT